MTKLQRHRLFAGELGLAIGERCAPQRQRTLGILHVVACALRVDALPLLLGQALLRQLERLLALAYALRTLRAHSAPALPRLSPAR